MVDGRNATIVAPDAGGQQEVVAVPENKVFVIKRFHMANHSANRARIRFWDVFTDSDGTDHDPDNEPVLLGDYVIEKNESRDIVSEEGLAKAIGTVVARSTSAGAPDNDVTAGAWGEFV